MAAAFLTAVFFALSSVFAARSTRLLGYVAANFARLFLSTALLAVWAFAYGKGLKGDGLTLFVLSGVAGFGFGDLAFFAALPLIGSRLASLMVQCLAAPIAAVLEWIWLGTRLDGLELACGGLILAGVALAIAPTDAAKTAAPAINPAGHGRGLLFGLVAAFGQAGGAVISRKAHALSMAGGLPIDGGTAAFQRILGGLFVVSVAWPALRQREKASPGASAASASSGLAVWRKASPWVVANCLSGAVLGVSFYQWALATSPSAVVLPIVALTPLVVVPLAYFLDGERPGGRSLAGAALAVVAAAALARLR